MRTITMVFIEGKNGYTRCEADFNHESAKESTESENKLANRAEIVIIAMLKSLMPAELLGTVEGDTAEEAREKADQMEKINRDITDSGK